MAGAGDLNELTKAIQMVTEAQEGWARGFGELGEASNKWWTVFARLSSGSGLWKLQARIRSISNIVKIYTDNIAANREAMLKNLKSSKDVQTQMEKMVKIRADVSKSEYYEMLTKEGFTTAQAEKMATSAYDSYIKQMGKMRKKRRKELMAAMEPTEKLLSAKGMMQRAGSVAGLKKVSGAVKWGQSFFGDQSKVVGDMARDQGIETGKDGYIKRGNTAGLKFASKMGIGSQGVGANARNVLTKNKKQMALIRLQIGFFKVVDKVKGMIG